VTWASFVKTAYKAAREWGVQPSEFWSSSVQEWYWELESKYDAAQRMTPGLGGINKAEWAEARRRHKEKMKAIE